MATIVCACGHYKEEFVKTKGTVKWFNDRKGLMSGSSGRLARRARGPTCRIDSRDEWPVGNGIGGQGAFPASASLLRSVKLEFKHFGRSGHGCDEMPSPLLFVPSSRKDFLQ